MLGSEVLILCFAPLSCVGQFVPEALEQEIKLKVDTTTSGAPQPDTSPACSGEFFCPDVPLCKICGLLR